MGSNRNYYSGGLPTLGTPPAPRGSLQAFPLIDDSIVDLWLMVNREGGQQWVGAEGAGAPHIDLGVGAGASRPHINVFFRKISQMGSGRRAFLKCSTSPRKIL